MFLLKKLLKCIVLKCQNEKCSNMKTIRNLKEKLDNSIDLEFKVAKGGEEAEEKVRKTLPQHTCKSRAGVDELAR